MPSPSHRTLRRRTVYLVTLAGLVALIGGWTLAVSSTTTGPSQSTNITVTAPSGFTAAQIQSSSAIAVSGAIAAYANAGTQSPTTAALAGTPTALASCATGPCYANYLAVNGATVTAGDYALQLEIQVSQPASTGSSAGFDLQVEATINSGALVFGSGYFATGTATGTAQTVDVYLFLDLGVTTAPTISEISVQFNNCQSATACP